MPPPRFWSLDALRGGCAIIVFLSHWHLWCTFAPSGLTQSFIHAFLETCHEWLIFATWPTGAHHPAVLAFFVLSGFCIHYSTEWRRQDRGNVPSSADYFRRRFQRIMPVYWIASLLGLLLVSLEYWGPTGNPLLQFQAQSSTVHTLVRFFAVAGVYPEEIFVGNYILNTVAAEIVMYAVYPLFLRFALKDRWGVLGLAFGGLHLCAIILLLLGVTPYWVFNSIFMLGLFWFMGALLAHGFVTRRWRIAGWWVLLAWGLFLVGKQAPRFYGLNLLNQALWGVVCCVALLWALSFEEKRGVWRRQRIVQLLCYGGKLSYSLYAVHTPVIFITTWMLLRQVGSQNYFVQLITTLSASVMATLACYYWIECRFYQPRNTVVAKL